MSLRPLTWLPLLWAVPLAWNHIAVPLCTRGYGVLLIAEQRVLDLLFRLVLWSVILGILTGEPGRRAMVSFWMHVVQGLGSLLRNLTGCIFAIGRNALRNRH